MKKEDKALTAEPILQVQGLTKYFDINAGLFKPKKQVHAVENVSFVLNESETLGIVGESGSGKSTLARVILGLLPETGGKVFYREQDITGLHGRQAKKLHQELQMVFQDPYASLNPRLKIGEAIAEPMLVNHVVKDKNEAKQEVKRLLETVGLREDMIERFPHEFSGGQRQRIGIARALALEPKLIICDEPFSALDVSIQAQIINLLKELQDEFGYTYIFISHDLSVVKHICDRIGVMYLGKMVESADDITLFANPLHPYTQALFSAIPVADPSYDKDQIILEGDIPSPVNPPSGCNFHTRCPKAMPICSQREPVYKEYEPGHFAACLLLEEQEKAQKPLLKKEGDVQ